MTYFKFPAVFITVLFLTVLFSRCTKDTYVSDAERKAAEEALFLKFLDENYDSITTKVALPERTFGRKDTVDMVYWETVKGVGDTILSGQTVGYRYKLYSLYNNDTTNTVQRELVLNKYEYAYPDMATVDARDSRGYFVNYVGLNRSFKHMRLNGKAILLLPSSLTAGDYYTRYYEIEVVYVSH